MRRIERIFVHCTAGPQTQTVETIKKYWKTVKKWNNPGYHYIIKPDGEIVPLQPEDKPSNGVQGYNSTSINVCYIGGVDRQGRAVDNRTDAQKASLIAILKELHSRYPDAEIMGHRDIWGSDRSKWKKECPCFNAKEEYAHLFDPEPIEEYTEEPVEEPIRPSEPIKTAQDIVHPTISAKPVEKPAEPLEHPIITIIKAVIELILKLFKK